MPLSDHEENILAEIERQLARDDPRFADGIRRKSSKSQRTRRLRWSVAGFVVGFLCLLGLTFHVTWAVIGFGLMLVSVIVGVAAVKAGEPVTGETLTDRIKRTFLGRDHAH